MNRSRVCLSRNSLISSRVELVRQRYRVSHQYLVTIPMRRYGNVREVGLLEYTGVAVENRSDDASRGKVGQFPC